MNWIAALAIILVPVFASANSFCEGRRALSYAEQLANLGPGFDLDLLDAELFPGGSVVSGYEYEVEPAFTDGLYARFDRWKIGSQLIPTDTDEMRDESGSSTFGVGAKGSIEASFVRFFKNPCEAGLSKPYAPNRAPLKSKHAIGSKFLVGDYFIFKSQVGFVVSLDILKLLGTPLWSANLGGSYLVDGAYQVYIIRQDQDHIRFKVLARRGRDLSLGLRVGWSGEFDVFKVSALDRQLKRQVNPEPLKVAFHDTNAQVFLVDYVLNLRDPMVARAFDTVVRKMGTFENIRLASPFRDTTELEQALLLDLSPLEELYRSDSQNGDVSRIVRNLRTSSRQDGRSAGIDFGNKILGFEYDATSSTSRMTLRNSDDSLERYLLRSYDRTFDGHFAWSFSRLFQKKSFEMLLKANDDFSELKAINVVQTLEKKDKKLKYSEYLQIKKGLKKLLPLVVFEKIPFHLWEHQSQQALENFGLRSQIVLNPRLILDSPKMSPDEIVELYRSYIAQKGFAARDFYSDVPHGRGGKRTAEEQYRFSLRNIADRLSRASDPTLPDLERLENFMSLRLNSLFAQTGLGFLLTLRPEQSVRYDLNMSANSARIDFAIGDSSIADFYRKLLSIKAALEDDGLDLRREAESLTITKRAI